MPGGKRPTVLRVTVGCMKTAAKLGRVTIGLLAGVFVVAAGASWKFGAEVDNSSYDEFFRLYEPPS